ncbi:ankyrin repeat-containing domain protein [Aspergillus carlsbadensis]|nr:ankyrin repeat-containing domain protein [Aspergillus carlsbadensis]
MPYPSLPAETILQIAEDLDISGINALLRTSTWHASLLTPVLYNRAFKLGPGATAPAPAPAPAPAHAYPDDHPTEAAVFTRTMWNAAKAWKSKYITDYIVSKRTAFFIPPEPEDPVPYTHVPNPYRERTSTLGCMVTLQNMHMVQTLLACEDVRAAFLAITDPTKNATTNIILTPYTLLVTHPLRLAITNNDLPMFTLLLNATAGTNTTAQRTLLDLDKNLPLDLDHLGHALMTHHPRVDRSLIDAIIAAIVAAGGEVVSASGTGFRGYSPLCLASLTEHFDAVDALLDARADLWVANADDGRLPVEIALAHEEPRMARKLLGEMLAREGARPVRSTSEAGMEAALVGTTGNDAYVGWESRVLHRILRARYKNMAELVPTLLEAGADILARDAEGKNALELVEEWGRPSSSHESWPANDSRAAQDVAGMLLRLVDPKRIWPAPKDSEEVGNMQDSGYVNRCLWDLAGQGSVEQYHLILLSICIRTGKSALELGGEQDEDGNGDSDSATPEARSGLTHRKFTALHYICDSIRSIEVEEDARRAASVTEMAALLITHGADPAEQSAWKETPLLCAVRRDRPMLVKLLLQYPAAVNSLNVGDFTGTTPLGVAARSRNREIVEMLVGAGADLGILDKASRGIIERVLGVGVEEEHEVDCFHRCTLV